MNPATWFPWIALGFGVASLWSWWRQRAFAGSARTWGLMSLIFAAVSAWLRWQH